MGRTHTMKNNVQKVEDFIKERHNGQKRWNGDSYYDTHLLGVRSIAVDSLSDMKTLTNMNEEFVEALEIVALAHDLAEDQNFKESEFKAWLKKHTTISDVWLDDIEAALERLNKNYSENYLDFVKRAKSSELSRIVKIADITHNLKDLKKGSMKDKYLLAWYILKN